MNVKKSLFSILLSCILLSLSFFSVQAQQIKYQFRFLTQGANAYAPAGKKPVRLQFKKSPKSILSAVTDNQGNAVFSSARCNAEDPAELVFRSDFPDKTLYRVPVTISCGTEDAKAVSYSFGIYSLTYGKFLASTMDDLDGPCYQCKQD